MIHRPRLWRSHDTAPPPPAAAAGALLREAAPPPAAAEAGALLREAARLPVDDAPGAVDVGVGVVDAADSEAQDDAAAELGAGQ